MPTNVDVRETDVVVKVPSWRILTKNLAVARGVTEDGREVEGVGEARWSGEAALDKAVESLKENAAATDFSFRIVSLQGGTQGVRIEFVDDKGSTRVTNSVQLSDRKTVNIEAVKDGRSVTTEAKMSLINPGFRNRGPGWSDKLSDALEKAEKQFDRVGTTTVDD